MQDAPKYPFSPDPIFTLKAKLYMFSTLAPILNVTLDRKPFKDHNMAKPHLSLF